jgi:XFP C-terminal domain
VPELKVRVINVVNLMKLQPSSEHPHGLSDHEFDALFTTDKPMAWLATWCVIRLPREGHRLATTASLEPNVDRRMEDQGLTGRTSRRPIAAGQRLAPATGPKNRLIGSRLPNSGLQKISSDAERQGTKRTSGTGG